MAKMETFTDLFNGSSINTGVWNVTQAGSATIAESSSNFLLVTFPSASTSSTDGDVTGLSTYDLTNSYGYINVLGVASSSTAADTIFELSTLGGTGNLVRFVVEAGTLYLQYAVAYSYSTPYSVAFSLTTHAWWRIREGTGAGAGGTAGTVYWDTAPDAGGVPGTWTNRASVADPITMTALAPVIGGICYENEASPGTAKFRYFNATPSAVNKGGALLTMMGA